MKTPLIGGYGSPLINTGVRYNHLSGGFTWQSLLTDVVQPIPTAGTISELKVKLDTAPTGYPYIFTLMKNGSPTSLTCSVAVGETTGEDASNSVSVAAGDTVCIRSSYDTAPTNTPIAAWSTIFEGTDSTESIILYAGNRGSGTTHYYGLQHGGTGYVTSETFGARSRIPTGGTLKKLYAYMGLSDTDTLTFTVYKNGVVNDLSATIVSQVCTPDTTHSVAVVDDDYCQMWVIESGTIAACRLAWGLVFVPTTAGEFIFLHNTLDSPANNEYHGLIAQNPNATWGGEGTYAMLANAFTAKKIRVCIGTATGEGDSRTFCLRKYGSADTALTVDIAGASEVDDYLVTDVAIADWDMLVLKHTLSGTPATTATQISIVGKIGGADNYERSYTALLGLLPIKSRVVSLSRAQIALLGLKGIVSRVNVLTRIKEALLGLKAIAARIIAPIAITQAASNISSTTARINGKISDDGGASCEARFRWRKLGSIDLQVAGSTDDAFEEEGTGYCDPTNLDGLHRAATAPANRDWQAYRWVSNKLPPQGAIITAAYVKVNVFGTDSDDMNGNWHFEYAASPLAFSSEDFNITARTRTTSSVSWVEDSLGIGWKQTPSLITPLQEVIDDYDATAIVVIWRPNTDAFKECLTYAYDRQPLYSAILHIEWEEQWTETNWQNTLETNDTYYEDLTDLDEGTKYEFQTQAKNSVGEGEWSASAYFRTITIRTYTALLGLCPAKSRTLAITRSKTGLLGLLPAKSRVIAATRSKTGLLGLKATASRVGILTRTKIGLLALKPTAIRTFTLTRAKTVLLGLKSTASRAFNKVKSYTALLGLKVTASYDTAFVAIATAYLGLKATGSRGISLTRSKTALLGLKVTATYSQVKEYVRSAILYLGLKATATKTLAFSRVKTALLGLRVTATWIRAGRLLVIKVLTSQYRMVKVFTSQHRIVKVLTSQYRKIKALILGD